MTSDFSAANARDMTTKYEPDWWDARIWVQTAAQQGHLWTIVQVPRRCQTRMVKDLRERGFFCLAAFGVLFVSWK